MLRNEYIPSGCAISGIMDESGRRFSGEMIVKSMTTMRFRSNGLGGGYAAYGIYPENADHYALHIMYNKSSDKVDTEKFLGNTFVIWKEEPIPIRHVKDIINRPDLWRYFVTPKEETRNKYYDKDDDDIVIDSVMHINKYIGDAFVASSGKNMGVFKGVGYPEEIADFYRLDEYEGYIWTGHGRFPTNTPGWWGGAHPFGLLDWSIVHNGEISSYGINLRYLESFGYYCMLKTDTEVIAYLFDLLVRKNKLDIEIAAIALAAPFWKNIEKMPENRRKLITAIRATYGSALLNGPFAVVLGYSNGMIGLNDRIKLRPQVAGRKGDMLFMASEEAAIREVCPDANVWAPPAGEPVIGRLKEPAGEHDVSALAAAGA